MTGIQENEPAILINIPPAIRLTDRILAILQRKLPKNGFMI